MIFTSFEFILFFLLVLAGRALIPSFRREKLFLLAASYLFYMSWNMACGGLILFTSLVDYHVGRGLAVIENPARRKALLVASLVSNLGVLAFFKYSNFLLSNARWWLGWFGIDLSPATLDIILPAGISFFTFQSMSYTIDVYRRQLQPCRNLSDFLLFVAFFPQLLAGPIVRASVFLPQLATRVRASALNVEVGLAYCLLGAVKKMVLSDQIAAHVDAIFANPSAFDAPTLVLGVLGYAVQIYCDFSGYSDMAIGCGRIMGFRLPENFRMPYRASSMIEFWRRWHISLSTWLRDYLYISLGGNRRGTLRTYCNLMVTMLLGGLWHGASWNFVLWGGLHGSALAVNRAWKEQGGQEWVQNRRVRRAVWHPLSHLLTLGVVLAGWILFRSRTLDSASVFLKRIATWAHDGTRLDSPNILPAVVAVVLVHLLTNKDFNWAEEIPLRSVPCRILAYAALVLLFVCLGATNASPFIYFQF